MRAIALCLLILAASPFTAPFSTFDFDQSARHYGASDLVKVKATSLDSSTLGMARFDIAAPLAVAADPRFAARPHSGAGNRALHTILRL